MTDKELGQAAENWGRAHRAELVSDIIGIVNQKSVSRPGEGGYAFGTDCKNCADFMARMAHDYGFQTENDDYYTMSVLLPGRTEQEIGLLGHLDVVPEGDGWHYEPFNAIEKDGFVIGRGSSDNKGAVIMALHVMRALRELGVTFKHTIRLICGFNEEAGMKDVEHYLEVHEPPKYTIVTDGGWAMCIGEKGILNADLVLSAKTGNLLKLEAGIAHNAVPSEAKAVLSGVDAAAVKALAENAPDIAAQEQDGYAVLTASGKAGHAAFPWSADNAVYKLLHFLAENRLVTGEAGKAVADLAKLFTDDYGTGLGIAFEDRESGRTTCVGSILRFENGEISQHIDTRYAVTQQSADLLKKLEQTCTECDIEIQNLEYSSPRYSDPEAPVTQMLLDTVHEFLGREYEVYTMGGGTHARKFPNALPYGPGDVKVTDADGKIVKNPFGSPHGIDEAVSVEGLLRSMSTYAVALKRLDEML